MCLAVSFFYVKLDASLVLPFIKHGPGLVYANQRILMAIVDIVFQTDLKVFFFILVCDLYSDMQ